MHKILGVFILGWFSLHVNAQDSLAVASPKDSVKTHSWKRACLFSAVVPGSGQIYNHIAMPKGKKKAYWKVPLIYAGLGATTYFVVKNNMLITVQSTNPVKLVMHPETSWNTTIKVYFLCMPSIGIGVILLYWEWGLFIY